MRYRWQGSEKRRAYEEHVHKINHGSFTLLVLSTSGGMGKAASITYKQLASLLATEHEQSYSVVMGWPQCCLSFSLLHSTVMCLRGSHLTQGLIPWTIHLTWWLIRTASQLQTNSISLLNIVSCLFSCLPLRFHFTVYTYFSGVHFVICFVHGIWVWVCLSVVSLSVLNYTSIAQFMKRTCGTMRKQAEAWSEG